MGRIFLDTAGTLVSQSGYWWKVSDWNQKVLSFVVNKLERFVDMNYELSTYEIQLC